MPLLSVIVPVYNEEKTIKEILDKVNSVAIDKEIIVINDGSTDSTGTLLSSLRAPNVKVIHHTTNRGKGAAVLSGLSQAAGEFVIIQDADLEYDPADYLKLMEVIRSKSADLALGARFTKEYKGLFFHRLGNRFLTNLTNFLFNVRLNDCFTCYKLFRREKINSLGLKSQGFDIDIEIIAKSIKNKFTIVEVPVAYHPRNYSQGKKIRCKDGIQSALAIIKYSMR